MKTIKFIIPGDPLGYYAQAARSVFRMSPDQKKRAEKYRNYQETVKMFAKQAGISLPLKATEDKPVLIHTVAYFRNRRHCDPGNVQKGVTDALFAKPKINKAVLKALDMTGDDKYTGGSFEPPRYDGAEPRVEVVIEWWG